MKTRVRGGEEASVLVVVDSTFIATIYAAILAFTSYQNAPNRSKAVPVFYYTLHRSTNIPLVHLASFTAQSSARKAVTTNISKT